MFVGFHVDLPLLGRFEAKSVCESSYGNHVQQVSRYANFECWANSAGLGVEPLVGFSNPLAIPD